MQLLINEKNNNKKYDIRQGLTITQNYNETLDSVELVISHIKEKIDLEPYDLCEVISDINYEGFLLDESDNKYHLYMCIDKYNRKQLSVGQDAYYEYQISLFSQTKLLEGILLPSLKITSLKDANRFLIQYLNNYLSDYGPYYRAVEELPNLGINETWKPKWTYGEKAKSKFHFTFAPEMQWNNPTLRQVITDLMMVNDCIPVLRNGVIDCIDLTQKGKEMNKNYLNFVEQSQSSDDYVSELRMDMKNAISEKDNLVEVCELIGFRNSDVGILNDNNVRLETQHPIYDLVSLEAYCYLTGMQWFSQEKNPDGGAKYYKSRLNFVGSVDLVKEGICCENSVRQVKPLFVVEWGGAVDSYKEMSQYQNINFYYTRGDNKILGFSDKAEVYFSIGGRYSQYNFITLQEVMARENKRVEYEGHIFETTQNVSPNPNNLTNLYFKVKYRTSADALFQASKSSNAKNNRVVVDNQTNSYVDAREQGLLEYLKANRLGNEMLLINGRYKNSSNDTQYIAKLGDTYENSIIFRKQTSIFDDYTLVNYFATKDYVLRDYFTGVQAKQRSWALVNGNEAFVRNDLLKYYLQFSFKKPCNEFAGEREILNQTLGSLYGVKLSMLYPFATQDQSKSYQLYRYTDMQGGMKFEAAGGLIYPKEAGSIYYTEVVKRNVGQSLLFTFGLEDNIYVGKGIRGAVTGGYGQTPYRYADADGENVGGSCYLGIYKTINESTITLNKAFETYEGEYNPNIQSTFNTEINKKPIISKKQRPFISIFDLEFQYFFNKDNAEITRISLQFECCVRKGDDIELGKEFFALQPLTNSVAEWVTRKVYYSDKKYPIDTLITNTDAIENTQASVSLDIVTNGDIEDVNGILCKLCNIGKYTYIVNATNNKIIMRFATQNKPVYTIYFFPFFSRDERIYDKINNKVISVYDYTNKQ